MGRYRQLQAQYQALASEREASATASATASEALAQDVAAKAESAGEAESAVHKLEEEKRELIDKLKQVVGKCRVMQKQLQEAKEENEMLKSPARPTRPPPPPPPGDLSSDDAATNGRGAAFAAAAKAQTLEKELAAKEQERLEIEGQLKDVVGRYHGMQQQLEEKSGELDVAVAQVEAFKVELATQQQSASRSQETNAEMISDLTSQLKEGAQTFAQTEARVLVLQDENLRLSDQVAAILEAKQQQEQEHQAAVSENARLVDKVADVTQQLTALQQQQEDAEQLQADISAQLGQMLEQNKALEEQLANTEMALAQARTEKDSAQTTQASRADELDAQLQAIRQQELELRQQLQTDQDAWARERSDLESQISTLKTSSAKATHDLGEIENLREQVLVHMGVDLTFESISELFDTKSKEVQLLTDRLIELEMRLSDTTYVGPVDHSHTDSDGELATTASESEHHGDETRDSTAPVVDAADPAHPIAVSAKEEMLNDQVATLNSQIERYRSEIDAMTEKISAYELDLSTLRSDLEAERRQAVDAPTTKSVEEVQAELDKAWAHAAEIETEMAACKAENLRMIFEVAKTTDGAVQLKQDHESLVGAHRDTTVEIESLSTQLGDLEAANAAFREQMDAKDSNFEVQVQSFAKEKEALEHKLEGLTHEISKLQQEKEALKTDLDDFKAENDVLEERINELHAIAESKTDSDEWQERDREVENLRSSLVQAKVEFLEQKQQLTALEKKLVDISQKAPGQQQSSVNIDAERKEFEAALIEMIEMEKKLQSAYEAKQNLEMALQERMDEKSELEGRLSTTNDKVTEQEEQLEQMLAIISTLEDQLRSVEKEKEELTEEYEAVKAKLEKSEGKLEEKMIEFEAFRTTTNMLKDERTRLFGEIARLQEKLVDSEEQKAEFASSQDMAKIELEEQLEELADKIAELEGAKQDLRAQLVETIDRSDDEIDQLRERMYMMEEEKASLYERLQKSDVIIEDLEESIAALEKQSADLTSELNDANESFTKRIDEMEAQLEKASEEIATALAEKHELCESRTALAQQLKSAEADTAALATKTEEAASAFRSEIDVLKATVSELENKHSMVQKQLDDAVSSHDEALKQAEADKEALARESEGKAAKQLKKIEKLKSVIQELKDQRDAVQKELDDVTTAHAEMSKRTEADITALEKKSEDTIAGLQKEIDELKTVLHDLEAQRDAVQQQLLDAKSLHDETQKSADAVKSALEVKLEEDSVAFQKQIDALKSSVQELENQRDTLQTELENVSASREEVLKVAEADKAAFSKKAEETATELQVKIERLEAVVQEVEAQRDEIQRHLDDAVGSHAEELERAHSDKDMLTSKAEETASEFEKKIDQLKALVQELKSQRDEVQKQLDDAVAAHEQELKCAVADKAALATKSDKCVAELQQQIDELKSIAHDFETQRDSTQKQLDGLISVHEAEIVEKSAEVQAKTELVGQLEEAQESLQQRIQLLEQDLAAKHSELTASVELFERTKEEHATEAKTLEQLLEERRTEVEKLTSALADEREQSDHSSSNWRAKVDEMTRQVNELNDQITAADEKNMHSQSTIADLEHALEQAKADAKDSADDARRKLEELQSQYRAAVDAQQDTERSLDERTEAFEATQASLTEATTQVKELQEQLATISIELEQAIAANGDLKTKISSAEAELEDIQSQRMSEKQDGEEELNRIRMSESTAQDALHVMAEQHAGVSSELEKARSTNAELSDKLTTLEGELDELRTRSVSETQRLEVELEHARESERSAQDALQDIQEQLEQSQSRILAITEEHTSALSAVEAGDLKLQDLSVRFENVVAERQSSQAMVADLQARLTLSEDSLSTAQAAMETLRSQLQEQEKASLEQLAAQGSKAEAQLSELTENLQASRDELERAIADHATEKQQFGVSIEEKDDLIASLNSQLSELQSDVDQLRLSVEQQWQANKQLEVENGELKNRNETVGAELAGLKQALTESSEHVDRLQNELRTAQSDVANATQHGEEQIKQLNTKLAASQEELQALQTQHDAALDELNLSLQDARAEIQRVVGDLSASQDETMQLRSSIQEKEAALSAAQHEYAHLRSSVQETEDRHRHELAELTHKLGVSNESVEHLRLAASTSDDQKERVTSLEGELASLKKNLETEIDAANTARTQLEVYKKRAHVALKKATAEAKINLKKSTEGSAEAAQALMDAKGRIATLEAEAAAAQQRLQDVQAATSALVEATRQAADAERREAETALQAQLRALQDEMVQMDTLVKEKAPLENNLVELRELNEALKEEVAALKHNLAHQSDDAQEALREKDAELAEIKHQLHEALAAAGASSSSAVVATIPGQRHPSIPRGDRLSNASFISDKERRSSSTISSSFSEGEGNNVHYRSSSPTLELEQDHLSAAVADSRAIPLARLTALREPSMNGEDSDAVLVSSMVLLFVRLFG